MKEEFKKILGAVEKILLDKGIENTFLNSTSSSGWHNVGLKDSKTGFSASLSIIEDKNAEVTVSLDKFFGPAKYMHTANQQMFQFDEYLGDNCFNVNFDPKKGTRVVALKYDNPLAGEIFLHAVNLFTT